MGIISPNLYQKKEIKYSILKLNLIYILKLYFNKNILYNDSIKTNIFPFSFSILWNMKIIALIFYYFYF